ncbi:GNAT family N-acetyltransferase [Liquorilactobacillus ghanensis]|uniref:GNAT family N-acetyltransferase n=1 Tax=Liquorilactobacillus ghanensis TaxID=399370 RepID=UPI0039EA32DB
MEEGSLTQINKLEIGDVAKFLEFQQQLDLETNFMLLYPEERQTVIPKFEQQLQNMYQDGGTVLIAQQQQQIVGYLSAERSPLKKIHHVAYLVIGVRKKFRHQGIGKKLFTALNSWAQTNQVSRLELTVMVDNYPALHLYQQNGFKIEGIKQNSIYQNDHYVAEYYMGKII